jgi:uncharacterized damage-inducible protein DinB
MTYYGGKELAESCRTVRKNTLAIAHDIPADKYDFRIAPDTRSVGELLSHVALSYNFQFQIQGVERRATLQGFDFPAMLAKLIAEEKKPRTKEQIVEMLRADGEKWAAFLQGLSNEFLAEQVQMPQGAVPSSKSRFEMILSVKEHEMHHRGQLMMIERVLGIVPHLTRDAQARFAAAAAAKQAALQNA